MLKIDHRRSSLEVMADILRLGKASKTDIMYGVHLSHRQLKKYLSRMVELGLIDEIGTDHRSMTYSVTRKGLRLLRNIDSVLEELRWGEAYG
jgi:predicted transcriptional regulator